MYKTRSVAEYVSDVENFPSQPFRSPRNTCSTSTLSAIEKQQNNNFEDVVPAVIQYTEKNCSLNKL